MKLEAFKQSVEQLKKKLHEAHLPLTHQLAAEALLQIADDLINDYAKRTAEYEHQILQLRSAQPGPFIEARLAPIVAQYQSIVSRMEANFGVLDEGITNLEKNLEGLQTEDIKKDLEKKAEACYAKQTPEGNLQGLKLTNALIALSLKEVEANPTPEQREALPLMRGIKQAILEMEHRFEASLQPQAPGPKKN